MSDYPQLYHGHAQLQYQQPPAVTLVPQTQSLANADSTAHDEQQYEQMCRPAGESGMTAREDRTAVECTHALMLNDQQLDGADTSAEQPVATSVVVHSCAGSDDGNKEEGGSEYDGEADGNAQQLADDDEYDAADDYDVAEQRRQTKRGRYTLHPVSGQMGRPALGVEDEYQAALEGEQQPHPRRSGRHTQGQDDDEGTRDEDGDDVDMSASEDDVEGDELPMIRQVSAQDREEQIKQIGSAWQMGVVFDFINQFRTHLGELGSEDFLLIPSELMEQLVVGIGVDGLLARVHVDILNGVTHKGHLREDTWQAYLALRARREKVLVDGEYVPLFKSPKGREASAYCHLPVLHRVELLKFACELRCERDDIRDRIDATTNPKRMAQAHRDYEQQLAARTKRNAGLAIAPPAQLEDFRHQPVGKDMDGYEYYLIDFLESPHYPLLFRNGPTVPQPMLPEKAQVQEDAKKKRGKKKATVQKVVKDKGGSRAQDNAPGTWELIAQSSQDLRDIATRFAASRNQSERQLAAVIHERVLAKLDQREAELERRQRAAQRLRRQIGSNMGPGAGAEPLGERRARRERNVVSYRYDAYEADMERAIKGLSRSGAPVERSTRATRGRAADPAEHHGSVAENSRPNSRQGYHYDDDVY